MDERRRSPRYEVTKTVKGRVKPSMDVRVVNISEHGLMIEAPFGLPPAGTCELTLLLGPEILRHCSNQAHGERQEYQTGSPGHGLQIDHQVRHRNQPGAAHDQDQVVAGPLVRSSYRAAEAFLLGILRAGSQELFRLTILALMKRLCREYGSALILITHDIGVIAQVSDRVTVLRGGRVRALPGLSLSGIRGTITPETAGSPAALASICRYRSKRAA